MSIQTASCLSAKQLEEINGLLSLCQKHDGLTMSPVLPGAGKICDDERFFLLYEGRHLACFLSAFTSDEFFTEISAFTHPDYRRKGFFTKLLYALKAEKIFSGKDFLYLCDGKSKDALAVIKHLNMTLAYSEYMMEFAIVQAPVTESCLSMKVVENYDLFKSLYTQIFDTPEDYTELYVSEMIQNLSACSYIFYHGREAIGIANLTRNHTSVYLSGFGILPEYRRKGYGTSQLDLLIESVSGYSSHMLLQVTSTNVAAFRLYKKYGFSISKCISYYTEAFGEF